ncbi:hypothetical protein [Mageeibacillus indolicus]|uniref:Uncharacterized protein n=1 Tax=Mageeibacillus indolicus (strain UPII9-5) TaxID=699246 RepID=D3QZJ3_MAGIU|nr:hypothetical protein [Mageeibacillus indolicus]ADC91037.1 hypothetical protein HMPREF0868_1638 [Mageeibacillus indolicus UPII9-5]
MPGRRGGESECYEGTKTADFKTAGSKKVGTKAVESNPAEMFL